MRARPNGPDFGHGGPFGHGFPGGPFGPGFPGGPFARGGPRARKGDVRGAILSLLADGPSSGYSLIKAIAEKTGGVWRPSPGSIYPALQLLADEGLIAPVASEGTRSDYGLTDAGRKYVAEHSEELAGAWGAASAAWDEHGDLFSSTGRLLSVIRQYATTANPAQREQAVAKIDDLRRELYRILGD